MCRKFGNQAKAVVLLFALLLIPAFLTGCRNPENVETTVESSGNQKAEGSTQETKDSQEPETEENVSSEGSLPAQTSSEKSVAVESTEIPSASESSQLTTAPAEDEINEFLKTHYHELEHNMTLALWETADITPFPILSGIQWKSQNEGVAVVKDGKVCALGAGNTLLTAEAGTYDLFCNVEVTGYENMMIALNGTRTLPHDAIEGEMRLETDSPDVVAVEGNRLTAKAMGRATLTVYIDEVPYSFPITVTDPQISETSLLKIVGTTEQLSVWGTPSVITWKSDNEAIATVDENGLVTAAPGGIGQSTFIRALVDGTELTCQVTVEAIPQLSTSYRIYGYSTGTDASGAPVENTIALYANANETTGGSFFSPEAVLSMSSVQFTKNMYPVYYAYASEGISQSSVADGRCAHTQIYLLGTSQNVHLMVKDGSGQKEVSGGTTAIYTPQEGFGIIDVYIDAAPVEMQGEILVDSTGKETIKMHIDGDTGTRHVNVVLEEGAVFQYAYNTDWGDKTEDFRTLSLNIGEPETYVEGTQTGIKKAFTGTVLMRSDQTAVKVYLEIGGLTYQMHVDAWDLGIYMPALPVTSKFFIDDDNMNADKYVTEMAQGGGQVQRAGSNSAFRNSSECFVPGEWFEKMKGKFIDEVENQAVEMAVSFLFKLIFF